MATTGPGLPWEEIGCETRPMRWIDLVEDFISYSWDWMSEWVLYEKKRKL
jgi:hypothetical protein